MEVGVGGGYHDLLKFADQLAQLPRLVTLNELKVLARGRTTAGSGRGADLAPGAMRADLVAVVFQALPVPAQTPAAAPAPAPTRGKGKAKP
jgi:Tfp pilus assembly protein PilO